MDDLNPIAGATSEEVNPTSESEELTPSIEESNSEEQAPSEVNESEPDRAETEVTEERRPSRAERRIHELTKRLKETQQRVTTPQPDAVSDILGGQLPWQNQPMFSGDEVSSDELERAINNKAAIMADLTVKKELAKRDSRDSFVRTTESWISDAESTREKVSAYGEAVEESFSKLVEKMNKDDNGNLVPKIKASEIWDDFSKALEITGTKRAGQVSASLAQQQAESATPPTTTSKGKDYSEEELFNEASSTGDTKTWAEYLKKRMFKSS